MLFVRSFLLAKSTVVKILSVSVGIFCSQVLLDVLGEEGAGPTANRRAERRSSLRNSSQSIGAGMLHQSGHGILQGAGGSGGAADDQRTVTVDALGHPPAVHPSAAQDALGAAAAAGGSAGPAGTADQWTGLVRWLPPGAFHGSPSSVFFRGLPGVSGGPAGTADQCTRVG